MKTHKQSKKREEWIKPICANDHIWGNGKDFSMEDKCPKCGGDIVGFRKKKFMTIEEIKTRGWILTQNFMKTYDSHPHTK